MTDDMKRGLALVQQQLKELDAIFTDTMETLNTVAGAERLAKCTPH